MLPWLKKKWIRHWQRRIWQPSYREPMVSIHVPFYKFIFVFATAGSENCRNLKFPHLPDNSTNDSLHAFGALRTFRAGWLWCSCCCAEQERCHATKKGATAHRNSSDDPALRCFWTVFVTSNGKNFHLQKGCKHIVGKQMSTFYILMLQKLHETVSFHLRRGWMTMNYRVKILQNGSGKKAVDAEFLTR